MTTEIDLVLALGLLGWLAVSVLLYRAVRSGQVLGVGIVLAYLLHQAISHWLGALVYVFPGQPIHSAELVGLGYFQTIVGVVAFSFGALIVGRQINQGTPTTSEGGSGPTTAIPRNLAAVCIGVGMVSFTAVAYFGVRAATITALLQTASNLLIAGLVLAMWQAHNARQHTRLVLILLLTITFPFLSITLQGYLGYGFFLATFVICCALCIVRPRWTLLAAGLVFIYFSLSVYVTYMRDRDELRQVIWNNPSLETRVDEISRSLNRFEWFDLSNPQHLYQIDRRLNQNLLVGAVVDYMGRQHIDYAEGATLADGILALIPRALWTDKTIVVGGADVVSKYTGLSFAEGTSVGIGQFMEFYINFGTVGVAVGMFIYGGILALFDYKAAAHLRRGNWRGFILWYLPAFGFFAGAIIEVTANVAAAFLAAVVFTRVMQVVFETKAERKREALALDGRWVRTG